MRKGEIQIIYEDAEVVVINKPAGISVTGDRSGDDDILQILSQAFPMTEGLRLVHRLDKCTSGVMILAKTRDAQSRYTDYFVKRLVRKTYLALVAGIVSNPTATIDAPLAQDRHDARRMRIDQRRGKAALTRYRLLADFGSIALLAVSPETGRTHQIRVHLASVGLPLVIDPLYGTSRPLMLSQIKPAYRSKKDRAEPPLIDRLTLHAYQLEVPADQTETRRFIAPLDKKFAAAVKMLAKHNPNGFDAFQDPRMPAALLAAEPI
ncbi:MAG: RluA family pseudouridine synthase [Phycisphaerae bacterium]|nr:RluA family pseudouridine synthase [Phycisphaerae bacterium]